MDIIIESMLEEVLTVVISLIAIIASAAGTYFVRWINSKTKNEKLTQYAELLSHYAQIAVNSIAQTQADILKEAASDGKLTDEEKTDLKNAAIAEIKKIAPDAILAFHAKMNTDLDALINALVESVVHNNSASTLPGE